MCFILLHLFFFGLHISIVDLWDLLYLTVVAAGEREREKARRGGVAML